MRYTFGPVNSRRFGLSLGVDLSPEKKSCNFDCLYCELEASKPVDKIENPPDVEDILFEIKKQLNRYPNIDVITITANGEPTLYPNLDILVKKLNSLKKDKKLLILSNASTINNKDIQQTLLNIDIVKLSLDCATQRCFKRLDRPLKNINLEDIIKGIISFSKIYKHSLIIEILVVKGVNDNKEEFIKLNNILQQIKPSRIDLGTIDRPPAYRVEAISYNKLFELSKEIKDIPINIVTKKDEDIKQLDLTKEEILNLLAHRPLTKQDIEVLFNKKTKEIFYSLIDKEIILEKSKIGEFFKRLI
jgi:wyosine [tRNA(Phe)-imidazoG37] synthetase (radical SAM superfamily)